MRRLKIAVCLIFVASCVIFAGYTVKSKMLEDHTPPVITCKDKTVTLSVQTDQKKQKKALLKGVKAEDNRDGDLTSSVRIASMSHFIALGKRTITYVVFDKANEDPSDRSASIFDNGIVKGEPYGEYDGGGLS